MYNLATLAIIHKLITYFCILVRPRQKLKMFGFIKHTCCTTEEKSHYKKMYFFEVMKYVLKFANQKMMV